MKYFINDLRRSIFALKIFSKRTQMITFIPTQVKIAYELMFTATINKSGRMQYHKTKPGLSKIRIGRNEFLTEFNSREILAIRPIQQTKSLVIQFEFFV